MLALYTHIKCDKFNYATPVSARLAFDGVWVRNTVTDGFAGTDNSRYFTPLSKTRWQWRKFRVRDMYIAHATTRLDNSNGIGKVRIYPRRG